jgi:protein-S-isoprenylcysteine O-methyltransferase Ste14
MRSVSPARAFAAALFTLLVAVNLQHVLDHVSNSDGSLHEVTLIVYRGLGMVFAACVAGITLLRRSPLTRRASPLSVAVSMVASVLPLFLGLLSTWFGSGPLTDPSEARLLVGNAVICAGLVISLYALAHLRFNFSILPEARSVTSRGPYSWVRHPVYLGEILSFAGMVLVSPTPVGMALWVLFVSLQWIRAGWEEDLLQRSVAGYAAYAQRTRRRIIPGLV